MFFQTGKEKTLFEEDVLSSLAMDQKGSTPAEVKTVTLFLLSERDDLLHPENREIIGGTSIVDQIRQTIEELIRESQKDSFFLFPPETELRGVFITQEGIAYVDFSRHFKENHLSGSSAEISTIYSIVNSLTYNFDAIRRVFILIDGREQESLSGHIDLRRPLLPRYDLNAR